MGQTVDQAITHIRRHLEGRSRLPLERLDGVLTTTAETVTMEFGDRNLRVGTIIEIENELVQITDDTSAPTYSIIRELDGGSAAAQHVDNTLVRIEPRISKQFIMDEMLQCINDLPDSVYATAIVDIAFSTDQSHAELTGAFGREVLWARAERDPDPSTFDPYMRVPLNVFPNDGVTSGWIVQIAKGASYETSQILEVTYGFRYDTSVWNLTRDLVADIGLNVGMLPTIHAGTISRILAGEELQRQTPMTQAQPRRAEEVPAGILLEVSRDWERRFERGLAREASRLRRQNPISERS